MAIYRYSRSLSALLISACMLISSEGSAQNGPGAPAPVPVPAPSGARTAAPPQQQPPPPVPNAVPYQPGAVYPGQPGPYPNAPNPANPTMQPGMPGGFMPGQVPPQMLPGAVPPGAQQNPGQKPPMDGATYSVRLRELEQRIDELKEQIRRSHTRLSMLSDTIIAGSAGGSRAVVKFTNELSNIFRITRVLVVLDGAVQYNKTDQSGALSEQTEIPIYDGSVPPGDHTLQVLINLQGHGFGAFSYMRAYRFEVRSTHSFTAQEGKTIKLQATAFEKGTATSRIEERPAVRYSEKTEAGLTQGTQAQAAPR